MKNAACNNDFAKGLIAGKPPIWAVNQNGQYTKMEYDDFMAILEDERKYLAYEIDDKEHELPQGTVEIYPAHPPLNHKTGIITLFFGLKKKCPSQYLGEPNAILYGPLSTSEDIEVAKSFAGFNYGSIFTVTLYRDQANAIGGIIDGQWLSPLMSEDEWILYDVAIKHIKLWNPNSYPTKKNAKNKNPCFYPGTKTAYDAKVKQKKQQKSKVNNKQDSTQYALRGLANWFNFYDYFNYLNDEYEDEDDNFGFLN